jgi:chloramphenicol O-acetyltransferase type A
MPVRDIDIATWPRRSAYEHFRPMTQGCFSVTALVVATGFVQRAKARGVTPWLAYHHAALVAVNQVPAFRCRFSASGVREWVRVHASTTVLRADQSFGIVSLRFVPELAEFAVLAAPGVARVKAASGHLFAGDESDLDIDSLIHMTALPWLNFTSFHHARDAADATPKIAIGRLSKVGDIEQMPVSVDVHHALVDGLHVAQFFEAFQAALDTI